MDMTVLLTVIDFDQCFRWSCFDGVDAISAQGTSHDGSKGVSDCIPADVAVAVFGIIDDGDIDDDNAIEDGRRPLL